MGLIVQVRDLACGYDERSPLVEHATFSFSDHEVCCVLGPNGVGKTTLFKTVLGFVPALAGGVYVDGEDVSRWRPRRMAQTVAYVAQNHVPPFPYLVEDVVMLGRVASTGYFRQPSATDRQAVEDAMGDMGVAHLRGRAYTDVSGGERQLVMLAQAIAREPRMLFLDEPTASLDYGNQVRVLEKVCALRDRGYAVLMTTHAPEHAFLCDAQTVLLLRDAPPVCGSAEEVVTERNLRDAYGVRVRVLEHFGEDGEVVRTCSPVLGRVRREDRGDRGDRGERLA